jgi:hypothetical protein
VTRRVHDSYMAYKAKFDAWSAYSEVPSTTQDPPARDGRPPRACRARAADRRVVDRVGRSRAVAVAALVVVMAANVLLRYGFSLGRSGRRSWNGT